MNSSLLTGIAYGAVMWSCSHVSTSYRVVYGCVPHRVQGTVHTTCNPSQLRRAVAPALRKLSHQGLGEHVPMQVPCVVVVIRKGVSVKKKV